MGATAGGALLGTMPLAMPQVRKKVKLTYWAWSDNPFHQKISTDAVAMFNASQNFVEVEVDASMVLIDVRKKLVTSYAAGGAPDVCMNIIYWAQDLYDNGIIHPVGEYFDAWEDKEDFFPTVVEQSKLKPDQPLLFLPLSTIPYFLYYRADWLQEAGAKVPETFGELVTAAKAMTKAPDRYGLAMRGTPYNAVEVVTPIYRSNGVKFVENGEVDFDSPQAIEVTEAWANLYLKEKVAPPSAPSDGMKQLYALMEGQKTGMWLYGPHGSPTLATALGDAIQGTGTPRYGDTAYTIANPEGPSIISTCPEKEAAWEFVRFIGSGEPALLYTAKRAVPTVRNSVAQDPEFQNNRFLKLAIDLNPTWWTPPYYHEHWGNFSDKISTYWQEVLLGNMTPADYNKQGAKFLRGEA
jgi:multiple sugar transport system substrate-binding protein